MGRDYVLRRIIRRASYAGKLLGLERPFLAHIADVVIDMLSEVYPEIVNSQTLIREVTTGEEVRFHRTLQSGLRHIEIVVKQLLQKGKSVLPGNEAFKLYDTYGFPLDLTQKILTDRGLSVDVEGYEEARRDQQQRSRLAAQLQRS